MDQLLPYIPYITALSGFLIGVILTWFVCRYRTNTEFVRNAERLRAADKSIADLEAGSAHLEAELQKVRQSEASMLRRQGELEAQARASLKSAEEKHAIVKEAERQLAQTFQALSQNALRASQEEFVRFARTAVEAEQKHATEKLNKRHAQVETIVQPVAESLEKVQSRIAELEKAREGAYSSLEEQVREMNELQQGLQKETGVLARAIRRPAGRGRWGEMQLRRVVELAGMQEYCDFAVPVATKDGHPVPDLLVNLPGGQRVVVDAKAPMEAYLESLEADDDAGRETALTRHARQIAGHLKKLGTQSADAPSEFAAEFTVLFFPSESFFASALAQDASLIEKGVEENVILATPTTLIALLRAIACGWRQESITANARAISEVGRELHDRVTVLTDQFARMGRSLDSTVRNYNKALGTVEAKVLPCATKLEDLGVVREPAGLPALHGVPHHPRLPRGLSSLPISQADGGTATPGHAPPEDAFEGFAPADPDAAAPITLSGAAEQLDGPGDATAAAGDLRAAVDETVVKTRP